MTIFSFAMFFIALVSFALACFVFLQSRKTSLNKIFILLHLSTAGWSGFLFLIYDYTKTETQALFLSRAVHTFGAFIPVFFLHFVYLFPGGNKKRKIALVAAYLWALLMAGIISTKLFIKGMTLNFRTAEGFKKNQIKYILLAIVFGFGGGSASFTRPFFDMPALLPF